MTYRHMFHIHRLRVTQFKNWISVQIVQVVHVLMDSGYPLIYPLGRETKIYLCIIQRLRVPYFLERVTVQIVQVIGDRQKGENHTLILLYRSQEPIVLFIHYALRQNF